MADKIKMISCKVNLNKFKDHLYKNVYKESLGVGFVPISVTRDTIKAKHVLRSEKDQSVKDHLGNKVSTYSLITFNIIEFKYCSINEFLYVLNPPRSLKPLLKELSLLKATFDTESYLNVDQFINLIGSESPNMRITSVTCNNVPLNLKSSVTFTISSASDARKHIKEFYSYSKLFINSCVIEGVLLDTSFELEVNSKMVIIVKKGESLGSIITEMANKSISFWESSI